MKPMKSLRVGHDIFDFCRLWCALGVLHSLTSDEVFLYLAHAKPSALRLARGV